jgi:hypothetical protein
MALLRIQKKQLVALLMAIGFPKAKSWTPNRLRDKGLEIPHSIARDDIPREHRKLFDEIRHASDIGFTDGDKNQDYFDQLAAEAARKTMKKEQHQHRSFRNRNRYVRGRILDPLGCVVGAFRARVNSFLMDHKPKTADQIAQASKLPKKKILDWLYQASHRNLLEVKRTTTFRIPEFGKSDEPKTKK